MNDPEMSFSLILYFTRRMALETEKYFEKDAD